LDSCFQKTPLIFPALVVRKTSSGSNNVRDITISGHQSASPFKNALRLLLSLKPSIGNWLHVSAGKCAVALLLEASRDSRTGVGITVTGLLGYRLENPRTPAAKNTSTHRFQGVKPLLRHASHWTKRWEVESDRVPRITCKQPLSSRNPSHSTSLSQSLHSCRLSLFKIHHIFWERTNQLSRSQKLKIVNFYAIQGE
jgi:hypothetical protein